MQEFCYIKMKIYDIPVNTVVELQFEYLGDKHIISTGLLYKIAKTVYVSAIKDIGGTINASKLKKLKLVYKAETGVYKFHDLVPRSISFNGQNLYAIHSEQNAEIVNQKSAYRLFIGEPVTAKVIINEIASYMSCVLKDISMTGMGIVSNQKIDEFARIEISIRVNENKNEKLTGNIIHVYEFKNGKGYLYGCEFDEPSETIGKYVIKQHEHLIKKTEYSQ